MIINRQDRLELAAITFTPAALRLIDRYIARLRALDPCARADAGKLYYAAASAVECLQAGHEDARLCVELGGDARDAARCREVSRIDAEFYLDLGRGWVLGRAAA